MRRAGMAGFALLCTLALASAALAVETLTAAEQHPARVNVAIENYAFQPDPVTVAVGTTVVWTNRDEVTHTVVGADKSFSSPELEPNHSFEFTFKKAGTFPYSCTLHPEMKGKVIVK